MVPFIKSFILADLNDDVKFRNYTYWSTNDTRTHHLSCQVSNRHNSNKNLIFMSHVKISLYGNFLCKGVPLFFPYIVHILSNKMYMIPLMMSCVAIHDLQMNNVLNVC